MKSLHTPVDKELLVNDKDVHAGSARIKKNGELDGRSVSPTVERAKKIQRQRGGTFKIWRDEGTVHVAVNPPNEGSPDA